MPPPRVSGTVVGMTWSPSDAGRRYWRAEKLNDLTDRREELAPSDASDANLVGSARLDGLHAPVLDVDKPVRLVPSTTTGHHHLYIDVPMSWRSYRRLLRALYLGGVVDRSVYWRSLDRRATYVRPPWVVKTAEEAARGDVDAPQDPRASARALRAVIRRVLLRRTLWFFADVAASRRPR